MNRVPVGTAGGMRAKSVCADKAGPAATAGEPAASTSLAGPTVARSIDWCALGSFESCCVAR